MIKCQGGENHLMTFMMKTEKKKKKKEKQLLQINMMMKSGISFYAYE